MSEAAYVIQLTESADGDLMAEVYWGDKELIHIGTTEAAFSDWSVTQKAKRIIRRHKRLAKRGIFLRGRND